MRFSRTTISRMHRRGVTLLECLATLLLLGLVLPVVMEGISMSLQAASRARHSAEAAVLAELKINEMLVLRSPNELNRPSQTRFEGQWSEYSWSSVAQQSSEFNLYSVTVSVHWIERRRPRQLKLSTLIYPRSTFEPSAQPEDDTATQ